MSRYIRLATVPALLTGAFLALGAIPASASATGDSLQNGSAELCLSATAAGAVSAIDCSGPVDTLQWTAPYVSGGIGDADEVIQLQNVVTSQCLTASASGAVSTASCGTSPAQDWTDDGSDVLLNKATGLCLTGANPQVSSSETVDVTACSSLDNPSDSQQWFWGAWE